jgi:transcriptional antiterminator RfaH
MARWYVIYTKAASEAVAKVNLERQGYRVYLPRLLQPARNRGRWLERIVALFPRYLFVQLETGQQALGPVRSTVGVASVVRFGTDYAIVPDRVIEALGARADSQTGLHRLAGPRPFSPGTKVRVTAGAFDGLEGVFQRESAHERVIVLLEILGRGTPVRIPAGFVIPQVASC